ncbi:MAG TPA: hypothetical protein VKS78_00375 [Roseiarcus sp.]|nr:hypothetical protein [Roseiarcus sp.]
MFWLGGGCKGREVTGVFHFDEGTIVRRQDVQEQGLAVEKISRRSGTERREGCNRLGRAHTMGRNAGGVLAAKFAYFARSNKIKVLGVYAPNFSKFLFPRIGGISKGHRAKKIWICVF